MEKVHSFLLEKPFYHQKCLEFYVNNDDIFDIKLIKQ